MARLAETNLLSRPFTEDNLIFILNLSSLSTLFVTLLDTNSALSVGGIKDIKTVRARKTFRVWLLDRM